MAAGLSFKIKGDSTGFVSSVKKAEKSIGGLADKIRAVGFGKLSGSLKKAANNLNAFSRTSDQKLALSKHVDSLTKKLKKLTESKRKVSLDLKSNEALVKLKKMQGQLRVLQSNKKTVKITVKEKELIAGLKRAKASVKRLQANGARINLRLTTKQAEGRVKQLKANLKRVKSKTIKVGVKMDSALPKFNADLKTAKLRAAAIKFSGAGKLKGKSAALDKLAASAGRAGGNVRAKLVAGLLLAARASDKMSVAGKKLNRTLAVTSVVAGRALLLVYKSALLATRGVLKLASAGRKLVGVGFSKLKGIAFAGIKVGAIAATAAVTGLMVALKKSIEVAASLEQLQVQFTSITGSPDDAVNMVKHLREESKRTGVEIGAMAVMIRRLLASGMDVTEAKKMTASLLDISGALGLTSEESKLLGVAISQVKAKGIASMEELRQQISEKGVEIFKVLEQKLGKKGKDLFDMIAAGAVGADVVVDAFMNLEGPLARFRGGTDRMAATFTGSLRRMKAQIIDTFAVFGQPFLAGLSSAMDAVREKVKQLEPAIKKITDRAGSVVGVLVEAFKGGKLGEMIKLSLIIGGKAMVSTVVAGLKAGFVGASIILKNAFTKITDINFWKGVADLLSSTFKMMQIAMMEIALMFNPFGKKEKEKRMMELLAQASQEDNNGMDRINNAGNAKPIDEIFAEAGQAMARVIKDSISDPAMDGTKEQILLNKLHDMFLAEAKKREEERAARMNNIVPPDVITPPENKDGDLKKFSQPIVTSLQRIGGAAINGGKVDVERTLSSNRNKILTEVRDRIKEGNDKLDGIKGSGGKPKVDGPKVDVPLVVAPPVGVAPQTGMVASFMEGLRGLSSSMNMDGMMNLTREGNGLLRSIDVKMGQQRGAVYV